MKVSDLIALLQTRHPDAHVEIYFHENLGSDEIVLNATQTEYALFQITSVGDWSNPGGADNLVTINAGLFVGG